MSVKSEEFLFYIMYDLFLFTLASENKNKQSNCQEKETVSSMKIIYYLSIREQSPKDTLNQTQYDKYNSDSGRNPTNQF